MVSNLMAMASTLVAPETEGKLTAIEGGPRYWEVPMNDLFASRTVRTVVDSRSASNSLQSPKATTDARTLIRWRPSLRTEQRRTLPLPLFLRLLNKKLPSDGEPPTLACCWASPSSGKSKGPLGAQGINLAAGSGGSPKPPRRYKTV